MPVYEFYCAKCHKIYQFFARGIKAGGADKMPDCPVCGRKKLVRTPSLFSVSSVFGYGCADDEGEDAQECGVARIHDKDILSALDKLERDSAALDNAPEFDRGAQAFAAAAARDFLQSGGGGDETLRKALETVISGKKINGFNNDNDKILAAALNDKNYAPALEWLVRKNAFSAPLKDDKLYDL